MEGIILDDVRRRLSALHSYSGRSILLRISTSMGTESLIGAAAGGAFAGSTFAEVLKLLLGLILRRRRIQGVLAVRLTPE
jgi:hypothetical protein